MTQRNPMNERYQQENRKGQTRKSAASAKPTSKAGASVRMASSPKKGATPKQQKAIQRAEREREREIGSVLERKYYNPPTQEYKVAKRMWLVLLIIAAVSTFATWFAQSSAPSWVSYALLAVAYGSIIGALALDFMKIRKMRKKYAESMSSQIMKDRKALEKAQQENDRLKAKGQETVPLSSAIEMPEPKKKKNKSGDADK